MREDRRERGKNGGAEVREGEREERREGKSQRRSQEAAGVAVGAEVTSQERLASDQPQEGVWASRDP